MTLSFRAMSKAVMDWSGSPVATALAFLLVLLWCVGGVGWFGFGTDYQMWINTGTTIITFLMVFLIQAAQNRESHALQIKLDAMILGLDRVSNHFMSLEQKDEQELQALQQELRQAASGEKDTNA